MTSSSLPTKISAASTIDELHLPDGSILAVIELFGERRIEIAPSVIPNILGLDQNLAVLGEDRRVRHWVKVKPKRACSTYLTQIVAIGDRLGVYDFNENTYLLSPDLETAQSLGRVSREEALKCVTG